MKIGVIVDNDLNKDIRVLRELKILKDHGHEVFVLCFSFNNKSDKSIPGVTITRIRIKRWFKNLLFISLNSFPAYEWLWSIKTRHFILLNRIEVLHVHDMYMSRAVNNGNKSSGMNIPMVLDLHENYPYTVMTYNWTKGIIRGFISRPQNWKKKEREYLGYAQKIIVLSDEFRDLLITGYPELSAKNFTVLPNVPDLFHLKNRKKSVTINPFKNGFPVIFYFGVIAERRGVFDALEVFAGLVKDGHKINFLFIGPVDKKDKDLFMKLITMDPIHDQIHYIPWVDFSELWKYLVISDICIAPFHKNPQHESGVANKVYDYMLGGKPLIVSDCLPQKHLVEKYKCGLVYRDAEEMREAIIRLLQDNELRLKMGKNGYKAVMEELNTDRVKDRLILLYDKIGSSIKQDIK